MIASKQILSTHHHVFALFLALFFTLSFLQAADEDKAVSSLEDKLSEEPEELEDTTIQKSSTFVGNGEAPEADFNFKEVENKEKRIPEDLTLMSLEDLLSIQVTSVSKKAESLSETAAAVYVITQEEIRRSGATTIPDLLRSVPGVNVARIDSNTWAISVRGFNGQFANKLLVLIDGRSVYSPLFSGLFWAEHDLMLEDIERIEIIRGPGASVWGANAVNGVINIITQTTLDTQEGVFKGLIGNEEKGSVGVRYGGQLEQNAWYRVYAKCKKLDDSVYQNNGKAEDAWDMKQTGFRIDWDITDRDSLTLQGDLFQEADSNVYAARAYVPPYSTMRQDNSKTTGSNVSAQWKRRFSNTSIINLQLYYDRVDSDFYLIGQTHDTVNFDFHHQLTLSDSQEIVWGFGYRIIWQDLKNSDIIMQHPESRQDNLVSGFFQDEITILKNFLRLTVGSKFENNDYTGSEIQPTVRMLWTPHKKHTAWVSASRAARTPSTVEVGGQIKTAKVLGFAPDPFNPFATLPVVMTAYGSDEFDSENLMAFEIGYRFHPIEQLSLDLTTFYNIYDELRTFEPEAIIYTPTPVPHYEIPLSTDNKMDGKSYGAELTADWWLEDWCRFRTAYSFLQINLSLDEDSIDSISEESEDWSPHHQFSLRSYFDLNENLEFDSGFRYVDRLSGPNISSYMGFDCRLGWRPVADLEFSLVAQNLFRSEHAEFVPDFSSGPTSETERSVYIQVLWNF